MDDLLKDFLIETNEGIAELDVALVKLEQAPDDQPTLSLIFRMVHTIKGTCGFLGLARLEKVAHAGENVLGRVRDGALTVTPAAISLILAALDRIKVIVAALEASGVEPAGDDSELIGELNALAEGRAPAAAAPAAAAPAPPPEDAPAAAAEAPAPAAEPPPPAAAAPKPPRAKPARAAEPAAAPAPTPAPAPVAEAAAPPPAASAPAPRSAPPPAPPPAAAAADSGAQTIRVTVDVLEDLMTLVSELVLTRNQLLQLARTQDNSAFAVPLQRLSHITSDLQEGVMKTRMQPIGNAWNKLPRLVRDLSHELDKKIELVMLGAETELDRQVLELIKDPLTHMVRNSGDHGLEGPAERRAAGKPETGRIELNAYHEGGHIIIEIADDGRGLAVDKIRAKALANSLATEAELAAMTDTQIQRFIFRAGLSTAAAITAVSGRGVGMDVVKTNIEKIGGTIDLRSTVGQGTTFTIKIPLTLAIVSALIVQAGGERFAIPQLSVVELVHAHGNGGGGEAPPEAAPPAGREMAGKEITEAPNGIEHINGTPVLRLRDRLLPLINLNELLQLEAAPDEAGERGGYIVVAQVGSALLGIIVDRVFDTEEIVVKPVAPILRHITMFSGNTILGDGSVIMILDPNGIARATGIGGGEKAAQVVAHDAGHSGDRTAMLVFRAGGPEPKAVPLNLVARLEEIPRDKIETSAGAMVTQYRGRLMPLIPFTGGAGEGPSQAVLVFADGRRSMGLMVDEIVDVIQDRLDIELSTSSPGLLGTAVIGGLATDVIDTGYWLTQAWGDWFQGKQETRRRGGRLLVVDDSGFFRQLLVPMLSAAGYRVTAAENPKAALRLRETGQMFDAIISDIEMPEMDGYAFARELRAGGAWAELPLIALTSHDGADDVEDGRDAGFTDYVAKFDREALLASLQQCLSLPLAA
jgi:two-component system chemotaxis sensor kinase CheA